MESVKHYNIFQLLYHYLNIIRYCGILCNSFDWITRPCSMKIFTIYWLQTSTYYWRPFSILIYTSIYNSTELYLGMFGQNTTIQWYYLLHSIPPNIIYFLITQSIVLHANATDFKTMTYLFNLKSPWSLKL